MAGKRDRGNRKVALSTGSVTYIGSTCPYGHDGLRYTKHGSCVQCAKDREAARSETGYYESYYAQNKERIKVAALRQYSKDRVAGIKRAAQWSAKNPDLRRAISKSYKHRRRAMEYGGMSTAALARWTAEQTKICYWCGAKCARKFHVDHYRPLSKGGLHAEGNLVIACPTCNLRKSAKDPHQFAVSIGRLF